MFNILQRFYENSLFCPFTNWANPGTKFYSIVKFKNLIRESATIELPSAIFLSALFRIDTTENAIKAIEMR